MIDWHKTPAVVLGGAGFIGSHVVDELVDRGADVLVVDHLRRGCLENLEKALEFGNVQVVMDDLTQCADLIWNPEAVVFHMAARVTNIAANRKDHLGMLQDNLKINNAVIDAMRLYPPKVAVLCSTVCVYPHDAPVPTPESAAWPLHPEPTNEGYGIAKGALEKQGEYLFRELGIPTVVTRFSNAIGLRDYYDRGSSHVVPALIRRIMEGEDPLKVWGSGRQTRVFVDARDLACALVDLAGCPAAYDSQPVNIGHKYEIDIGNLALLIANVCGKSDISIEFDTSYPDGHARRAVDNSRLKSLIGWVPDRPLESTIVEMVAEYKAGRARL